MGDRIGRRRHPFLVELHPFRLERPQLAPPPPGHNGGPPLEDPHVPPWGPGGFGTWFAWRAAKAAAFGSLPPETALRRARKARELGLTFEEYMAEALDTGRLLQATDVDRIAAIKARRGR